MKFTYMPALLLLLFPVFLSADPPTPSPDNSSTGTAVDVKVDKRTKKIKVIHSNNDSKVVSKVYKLKHADPWDLKPFLEAAVGAKRINRSRTGVECIKYNDGTGAILVTAEAYRFSKDQGGGMSIDEIVASLDRPKAKVVDGMKTMVYFPKHRNAAAIARMINNVGLQREGDETELLSGDSRAFVDRGLNAVVIKATPSEIENLKKMLGVYDKAVGQITLSYKVYELSQENDEAIGNDYLAWKNGPGADLFTFAGRFTKGGKTKFVKFNPKWNSAFIDFLVTEKKAASLTSGTILLKNGKRYNSVKSKNSDDTGFNILLLPSIHSKTTSLDMRLEYKSDSSTSSISSKVQILNDGGKVIIGGLDKKSKVTSSTSPGMFDWLLGGSSDSVKTLKIVVILEANPPDAGIPPEAKKVIDEVKKELDLD